MRFKFSVALLVLALTSTQASAQLSATKTSDAGGTVAPGDVVQYTITVTNNTGTTHNNVTVSDPMPTDLSYIPNSTVATGPQAVQVFEVEDQFSSRSYSNNNGSDNFAGPWNEEGSDDGSATAGNIQVTDPAGELNFIDANPTTLILSREFDIQASGASTATFSFDYRGIGDMETTDTITVEVSDDGGSNYDTLEVINGATTGDLSCGVGTTTACSGSRSYDISSYIANDSRIRFSLFDFNPASEQVFIDNVRVVGNGAGSTVTLDNQPGGTNGDLDDGTAADLVTAADAFTLDNGDSLTVTFYGRVAAVPSGGSVTNIATIDSNEGSAFNAQVSDTINVGQTIGDRVWYDVDNDGNQDAGEVGIDGAIVNLHQGSSCASPVFKTVTTPVGGAYEFAGLSDGTYCVQVYQPSLPSGYVETSGNNPQTVTLAGGGSNDAIDFGMRTTACLPIIDFETDAAGNPLSSGDVITDQWEPWGVTFNRTLPATNDGAMIFDTDNPSGGDDDLGTPNEEFGGPGVGAEGGVGETGENRAFEHNIMILAENSNSSNPDDDGGGGTVEIIIDYPVEVGITTIIDMEENCTGNAADGAGEVRAYDAVSGGNLITSARIPGLGDNSHNSGPFLEGDNGRRVEIELCGSGGIAAISICESFAQEVFSEIGDRVWLDSDGDGIQDVGEPGINNVTVTLYDAGADLMVGGGDDVVKGTAVTDGLGNYLFQDLKDGTYYVVADGSTVPSGLELSPGSSATTTPTTVTNGDSNLTHDIGYTTASGTAIIGDLVWNDGDNDGVRDPGEPGIGNVTLDLRSAGVDGILGTGDDVVEATVTTTADGRYLFAGVSPGDYIVDVTDTNNALTGYTLSVGAQSNPDPSAPITMLADEVRLDIDFGYHNPSLVAITDRLWLDGDQDGVQDAGEPGISGVTVDLVNSAGVVIATDISDSNGDVSFAGIENGDYDLRVTDTFGRLTDYNGTTTPADNGYLDVFVFGFDVSGINFGYYGFGTIGDTVFSDSDGDGVQDPGELGIDNVTVTLWRDANGDQIFVPGVDIQIDSTTTTADGMYLFNNVYVGSSAFTYFVSVDDTQAALSGYTGTTTDDEVSLGDQIEVVLQALGDSDLDADFGYQNTSLPNVSGQVWHDIDADGFDDGAGEPGIGNVTIVLINSGGVVVAATTAVNGSYAFNDVPAGDYTVAVTDDNDVLDDYTLTSGLDQIPITVVATDITDVDFGYVRNPAQGEIGDLVWLDVDEDGIADGNEPGLGNVQLQLRLTSDDSLVATTTTGPNGRYLFSNLAAGNYYVDVVDSSLPSGLTETTGTVDPTATINLSRDGSYLDADFGYVSASGSLAGDFVWADVDGDGIQDPGEIGIGGVDITVAPTGAGSPVTVTTANDGSWLVAGLSPGEYTVNFDAADIPGIYGTTPTNTPPQYTFTVSAGGNYLFLDYGFEPAGATASIGDTVYFDADGDSTQDAGEAGLANVQVELRDSGSNIIATMLTDSNGNYDFVGLPAGTYSVTVNDINGVVVGLNATETPAATITVAATEDYNDADFGFEPTGFVIGNQVWRDLDGDGVRDAGEPGVQGVTLQLWLDSNSNGGINPGTDNLLETITTDRQGQYYFTGLLAEDYVVRVTDVNNVLSGFTLTSGSTGVDDNSQANPYSVAITTANNLTADFGYFVPNPAYLLSGNVFEDVDDDGALTSGDVDVASATLYLYRDLDMDGVLDSSDPLLGTQTSDSSGFYSFTNLPNGTYIVESDTTGTAVDGYTQTTQTMTAGVQPATINNANSTGNDFGYNGGAIIVPITLSYFEAIRSGNDVHFSWETATETANVGFEIHEGNALTATAPLGKPVPSLAVDSVEALQYSATRSTAANTFWLADLDTKGEKRLHGPFSVNTTNGLRSAANPVNWPAIRAEHNALAASTRGGSSEPDWVDIEVRQRGLQSVTVNALVSVGADWNGTRASQLRLRNGNDDIGIWVDGGEVLSGGSTIYFFGEPADTLYTDRNVYRLSRDGDGHSNKADGTQPGGRVLTRYQASYLMDDNASYGFSSPLSDPWYARRVLVFSDPVSESFDVEIDAYTGQTATLSFTVWGVTDWPQDNDHHLLVKLNGQTLYNAFFDGTEVVNGQVAIPRELLLNGSNLVEFQLPADTGADYDLINIESFAIEYQRSMIAADDQFIIDGRHVSGIPSDRIFSGHFESTSDELVEIDGFDSSQVLAFVSQNDQLTMLTNAAVTSSASGFKLLAPAPMSGQQLVATTISDLIEPAVVARWDDPISLAVDTDYLMITHPNFADTLQTLANFHRDRGLEVAVVSTEQIFQAYSGGRFDAHAIKAFIADTAASHPVRFVLLVGSDSYDYRDYTGNGSLSLVPSLYATTSSNVNFAPVDPLYVDLTGNLVPDLPIGRLPARTVAELSAIIDKTIAFGNASNTGNALFTSDKNEGGVSFSLISDQLAAPFDSDWAVSKISLEDYSPAVARQLLIDQTNAGVDLISYIGHSSFSVWSFDSLLTATNVAGLGNSGTYPIVSQWGCWNTYYVHPSQNTMAQAFLLSPDRGAAAVLGATTLTQVANEKELGERVLQRITDGTIGEAITSAKQDLATTHPTLVDVLLGWTLLGDPAIEMRR